MTDTAPLSREERISEKLQLLNEQLRTEISETVRDLTAEATYVAAFIDTRRVTTRFITAEAKEAMAVQNAKDRRDQAIRQSNGEPLGHGATAAPVNIAAVSLGDTTARDLRVLVQRTVGCLSPLQQVHELRHLPRAASILELGDHLVHLVNDLLNDRLELARLLVDLETLREALTNFIDGDDRIRLEDACPNCRRHTLVLNRRDWSIRCEKTAASPHYAPCTCPDPLCECKRRPVSYRHTWRKRQGPSRSDSWEALAGRLGVRRLAAQTTKPTRKKRK